MSERDAEQQDEATTDAPEASAEDTEIAETVDDAASELKSSKPSPQPEGTVGDPIGDAEDHIASLDMDEQRRKVQELSDKL